jgi:hypothetical protein
MNDINENERNMNFERLDKILVLTFMEFKVKLGNDLNRTIMKENRAEKKSANWKNNTY